MNAKNTYEEAEHIKQYIQQTFGTPPFTKSQKQHIQDKFRNFYQTNPRIFQQIVSGDLDWKRFKTLAETAYSLHLQMHTQTDAETARNVHF